MAAGVIRVMLADDQRVVREGLGTLLGLLDGIELVATAADGEEAIALAHEHDPDVVLMDLRMPRVDGIEAIRRLASLGDRPRAIALTTYADDASVLGALRAGARGYLTKDAGADEIRAAVEAVARGEAALDPRAAPRRRGAGRRRFDTDAVRAPRRADPARGRGSGPDRRGEIAVRVGADREYGFQHAVQRLPLHCLAGDLINHRSRQQRGFRLGERPWLGDRGPAVLGDDRQRALRQVADIVGKVGVGAVDDRLMTIAAVLAEGHLAQEEIAHGVHAVLADNGNGSTTCRPTSTSSRPAVQETVE